MRVAINGFGRIGSSMLRAAADEYDDVDVVAINDVDDYENRAGRAAHDTVYGTRDDVALDGDTLHYGDMDVQLLSEPDPTGLPWDDYDIDVALESTGLFRTYDDAEAHLAAGADKVIISAPPKDDVVPQFVYGVNHDEYDDENIVSNASCTTNCVSPVFQVLEDEVGVMTGMFDTVHSVTGTQTLVDQDAGKPERQWAGWQNIIPSTTGAADAINEVLPETGPKVHGTATRVPDLNASMTEFYVVPKDDVSRQELDEIFREAAADGDVIGYVDDADVPTATTSSLMCGRPESVVYDATNHEITDAGMHRLTGWYDNEYGFANRMLDLARHISND